MFAMVLYFLWEHVQYNELLLYFLRKKGNIYITLPNSLVSIEQLLSFHIPGRSSEAVGARSHQSLYAHAFDGASTALATTPGTTKPHSMSNDVSVAYKCRFSIPYFVLCECMLVS